MKTLKNKSCERGFISNFYDDVNVYGFSKEELDVTNLEKVMNLVQKIKIILP